MLIFGEVALHVMGEEEPGNVMSGLITGRESCGHHSALWPDSHWIRIIISFLAPFKYQVARLGVHDRVLCHSGERRDYGAYLTWQTSLSTIRFPSKRRFRLIDTWPYAS